MMQYVRIYSDGDLVTHVFTSDHPIQDEPVVCENAKKKIDLIMSFESKDHVYAKIIRDAINSLSPSGSVNFDNSMEGVEIETLSAWEDV